MDSLAKLRNIGFRRVGRWLTLKGALQFELSEYANATNVLYAFVAKGEIKYIGETTRTLSQRLIGYQNPGPTQRTNIRVNKSIVELLSSGTAVDICAFADSGLFNYGGFHVNLAAGLEASLVKTLSPIWNLVGNSTSSSSDTAAKVNNQVASPSAGTEQPSVLKRSGTLANQIRAYAYESIIKPAVAKGATSIKIRAGDIHDALKLMSRHPAVCGALGSKVFRQRYDLTLTSREGPLQGANVFFTFSPVTWPTSDQHVKRDASTARRTGVLGEIGERMARDILARNGFTAIRNLNHFRSNSRFADIYAERLGQRYVISVKTRNKYETRTGKLNSRYKLGEKRWDPYGLAHQAEAKWNAKAAWLAISIEPEVYSAYFGLLSQLRGNLGIPMTPAAIRNYECLTENQPHGLDYATLKNEYEPFASDDEA